MDRAQAEGAIEAVLFLAGDGIELEKLAEIFNCPPDEMQEQMTAFADRYNYETHGMKILQYGNCYQMATRPEYAEYLQKYAGVKRPNQLSNAALEVLSIIVYNQPVTRATIDKLRGVDSFGPLDKLIDRGIVEEKGRLDAPGRPILYGTTTEFLKLFGLKSMEDVPELEALQLTMEETLPEQRNE